MRTTPFMFEPVGPCLITPGIWGTSTWQPVKQAPSKPPAGSFGRALARRGFLAIFGLPLIQRRGRQRKKIQQIFLATQRSQNGHQGAQRHRRARFQIFYGIERQLRPSRQVLLRPLPGQTSLARQIAKALKQRAWLLPRSERRQGGK